MAPRNVPCCQEKASHTSGIVVGRRPPNRMAEIGTPLGSSHAGSTTGHWAIGAVNRALGWAALRPHPLVHSPPCQSVRVTGISGVMSSHQTSPSGVMDTLVKILFLFRVNSALGLDCMEVPGATPKQPASGLIA